MNDSAKTSARAGPIKLIKWTMAEQNPVGWGRKGGRDREKTEGWANAGEAAERESEALGYCCVLAV